MKFDEKIPSTSKQNAEILTSWKVYPLVTSQRFPGEKPRVGRCPEDGRGKLLVSGRESVHLAPPLHAYAVVCM